MDAKRYPVYMRFNSFLVIFTIVFLFSQSVLGADLDEIKKRGVLRHLGVPYANFVTGSGDGLDVEMMKLFAQYLGVEYQYVKTSWKTVISDLIGHKIALASFCDWIFKLAPNTEAWSSTFCSIFNPAIHLIRSYDTSI
jgi:hypothetical protein